MIHKHSNEVESQWVTTEGARDTSVRMLIGEEDGAPNFQMRMFEVDPGGHSPFHSHPWEHETYIVAGKGSVKTEEDKIEVATGDAVFIPADELHSFQADAGQMLVFICCVPNQAG